MDDISTAQKVQPLGIPGQDRAAAYGEADEQLHLMVASVTDGAVFTLDTAGTINSCNRSAEKINGYSAANIIGHTTRSSSRKRIVSKEFPKRNWNSPFGMDQPI